MLPSSPISVFKYCNLTRMHEPKRERITLLSSKAVKRYPVYFDKEIGIVNQYPIFLDTEIGIPKHYRSKLQENQDEVDEDCESTDDVIESGVRACIAILKKTNPNDKPCLTREDYDSKQTVKGLKSSGR